MATMYRNCRFFLFFTFVAVFFFLLRIKNASAMSPIQKAIVLGTAFFAFYSAFVLPTNTLVTDWHDYGNMGTAMIINITVLTLIAATANTWLKKGWIILTPASDPSRTSAASAPSFQFRLPLWVAAFLLMAVLGMKAEVRTARAVYRLFSPSLATEASKEAQRGTAVRDIVDWAETNSRPGDLFWFDGPADFVFKAMAQRPTVGNLLTAETPWFTTGDQAALDYVKMVDEREAILVRGDWEALEQVCFELGVKFMVIQKTRRDWQQLALPQVFANHEYAVFVVTPASANSPQQPFMSNTM